MIRKIDKIYDKSQISNYIFFSSEKKYFNEMHHDNLPNVQQLW